MRCPLPALTIYCYRLHVLPLPPPPTHPFAPPPPHPGCLCVEQSLTEKPGTTDTNNGSIPRCGKGLSSQSQLSMQTPSTSLHPSFLGGRCRKAMLGVCFRCRLSQSRCSVNPHVQSHAPTSVRPVQNFEH